MAGLTEDREVKKNLTGQLSSLAAEQEERLAQNRADAYGLAYINLLLFPIDVDVLEKVPKKLAEKAGAVVFYRRGEDVRVGCVDPEHKGVLEVKELVNKSFKSEPTLHVISKKSLQVALSRYRGSKKFVPEPQGELIVSDSSVEEASAKLHEFKQLGDEIDQLSPTEIVSRLASGAVSVGASDVHVEPAKEAARIRLRIDGVLTDVAEIPRVGWRLLLSRVKVLAGLKLNVRDVPQDGSFVLKVGKTTYDVRVSILPGGEGENIVMRVLDRLAQAKTIEELGMKEHDLAVMRDVLSASTGMLLVTGPTGSGKTTSLASWLSEINDPKIKIITLENPIEYRIEGIEQTQIDADAGYTFAEGLRAILRQDPDVIMVGEIRDKETAETAVHAALTGHLVLATLHTNDAPGAVPRLIDLGVEPNVLAPAVNVIVAQRLVRVVCSVCAEEYQPDEKMIEDILDDMRGVKREIFDPKVLRTVKFNRAKGCKECNQTGYSGRVGIFEVLVVENEVEDLILKGADGRRISEAGVTAGMTTIIQDGWLKVIDGLTTVEEVKRVTDE